MRFAASISALAFAAVALAQDQTIHIGQVNGTMAFTFNPDSINATANSVITFVWDGIPGNHSVTQSSFATPCEPLDGGFNSGFVNTTAADASSGAPATWNLTVTDASAPIWFYCAQVSPAVHCTKGMVGSINAAGSGNKTFGAFQSEAKAASSAVIPATALSGVGALASLAPTTTGTLPISVEATQSVPSGPGAVTLPSSSGSGSGTGTGTSTASSTGTGGANSASTLSTNGFVAALAAVFGVALL